ncbi:hypothetical protein ES705_34583 [subsurface metagenome]
MRHLKTDRLQHFVLFYIVTVLLISCEKHPEPPEGNSNKIEFSSIDTVSISYRSAVVTCRIENTGGNYFSQYGFCWDTSSEPDLSSNKIELGELMDPGNFSDTLTSLLPNTTYYVRAYASSNNLIVYSNELSFITKVDTGTLTDLRDNKTYNTIIIGDLLWMAENLNFYTSSGSWYYDNDSANYAEVYGRLYTWEMADSICPVGWHLPTDTEWKELEMHLGMTQAQADNTGWRGANQGTELKDGGSSEFNALPGGYRNSIGSFYSINSGTGFWSSTESGSLNAWVRMLGVGNEQVGRFDFNKSYGFYVRCVYPVK